MERQGNEPEWTMIIEWFIPPQDSIHRSVSKDGESSRRNQLKFCNNEPFDKGAPGSKKNMRGRFFC